MDENSAEYALRDSALPLSGVTQDFCSVGGDSNASCSLDTLDGRPLFPFGYVPTIRFLSTFERLFNRRRRQVLLLVVSLDLVVER